MVTLRRVSLTATKPQASVSLTAQELDLLIALVFEHTAPAADPILDRLLDAKDELGES